MSCFVFVSLGQLTDANLYADSGQQLRADDPSALKDIIAIVQTKLSSQETTLTYIHFPSYSSYNIY